MSEWQLINYFGNFPVELTSGIMYFEGERITKEAFNKE